MRTHLTALLVLACSTSACGTHVPEHTVWLVSDCNGPERAGLFRFPATNFVTTCSGEEWGDCSTSSAVASQISGELEVQRLELEGYEYSGPFAYRVRFDYPADAPPRAEYGVLDYIECRWSTSDEHDEVGEVQDCYRSQCQAQLSVVD